MEIASSAQIVSQSVAQQKVSIAQISASHSAELAQPGPP
jgi:hypothetical protein